MSTPGRVSVTRRALSTVIAAVAAEQLGVRASRVKVDLADDATRLAVAIAGPARSGSAGPSLVELGATVRSAVLEDGARITGAQLGRVTVRITGHETNERRTR